MKAISDVITKGRVKRFTITYTDSAGVAIPLTNHAIKMEFRASRNSAVIATVEVGNGVTINGNVASFEISSAKTALLPIGTIQTDIKATPPGPGEPFDLAEITYLVKQPFTA